MWLFVLFVILFLLFKSNKKHNLTNKKYQAAIQNNRTPKKYKDMIRAERDMSRLTPDGELPVGWVTVYEDFIDEAKSEYMFFYNDYCKNKNGEPLKKYAALKSLLIYIEDAKRIYTKKGECFVFYFVNWLAKKEEVQRLTDELHYMEEHMDELIYQEEMLNHLWANLLKTIQAEPGIKQEQLYKRFDPELKHHIQNELYMMDVNGTIIREKSGRSYALYMKK